jgi:hypothetical protein
MALGYGADTWCGDSLVTGRLARGVNNVVLSQYRRLITEPGTLRPVDETSDEDELSFGIDLSAECGEMHPEAAVKILPARIRAELMKDDRVLDVLVTAQPVAYDSDGTATISFDVFGVLRDEGDNYKFTVSVTSGADIAKLILGGDAT